MKDFPQNPFLKILNLSVELGVHILLQFIWTKIEYMLESISTRATYR